MKIEVIRKKRYLEVSNLESEIKAKLGRFYDSIELHFPPCERLKLDVEEAKKFKECLIKNGESCSFSEEWQSDEVVYYRRFYFSFDKEGVEITFLEGEEYPVIEEMQPKPRETKFRLSNSDILAVIALITEFLKLREKFNKNEKAIEKKAIEFIKQQNQEEKEFIKKTAAEFGLEPSDVSEIFNLVRKRQKLFFPFFF